MLITFTSIHAIDINIHSPALFPQLAGGPVSFHADFNAFDAAPVWRATACRRMRTWGWQVSTRAR